MKGVIASQETMSNGTGGVAMMAQSWYSGESDLGAKFAQLERLHRLRRQPQRALAGAAAEREGGGGHHRHGEVAEGALVAAVRGGLRTRGEARR